MNQLIAKSNKFFRNAHGVFGLTFGAFLLIQGLTACILGFEEPVERAFGKPFLKNIERIHKGSIYGPLKAPYRVATGFALCYLSVTGIIIGVSTLVLKNK